LQSSGEPAPRQHHRHLGSMRVSQSVTAINPVRPGFTAPISDSPIRFEGKGRSRKALPTPAAMQKAERDKWRSSVNSSSSVVSFWETNTGDMPFCGPLEEESGNGAEKKKKNDRSDPSRDHARSRESSCGVVFRGSTQDRGASIWEATERWPMARGSTPGQVAACVEPTNSNSQLPMEERAHAGLPLAANQRPTTASGASSRC